jgi:hypothetical protein
MPELALLAPPHATYPHLTDFASGIRTVFGTSLRQVLSMPPMVHG